LFRIERKNENIKWPEMEFNIQCELLVRNTECVNRILFIW